jgi:hypothetical protein
MKKIILLSLIVVTFIVITMPPPAGTRRTNRTNHTVAEEQSIATERLRLLIPLYIYPSHYNPDTYVWTKVAAAQSRVPITVVINPNNGPDQAPPNADYAKGLDDLRSANVTLLGYISTRYGDRNIDEVKAEIDLYDTYYNINGIFLDEAASNANQLNYYQELCDYIHTKSNLAQVILNQGTHPDERYLQLPAANTLIIFENSASAWDGEQPLAYADRYAADRFAALIHSAPTVKDMQASIDLAVERNIRYVYITDDRSDDADQNPWNQLPSYWDEEIRYIQTINQSSNQSSVNSTGK